MTRAEQATPRRANRWQPGWTAGLAALLMLLAPALAAAAPDLRRGEIVDGLMVWPDHAIDGRYYHLPGRVALASDSEGRPRLKLLSTRYVGTAAAGNQGRLAQYNRLGFTVVLIPPPRESLEAARRSLGTRQRRSVDLRPLPVVRMPTRLVYQPLEDPESETTPLPQASLEAEVETQDIWTERSYALRLSDAEAQVLRDVLSRGGVRFSLAYGLIVRAVGTDTALHELQGSSQLVEAMRAALDTPEAGDEDTLRPRLAFADASSITADLRTWPDLVGRVDINERLPPGFAALEIRCYDFQHVSSDDLFEVRVDVRAQTVSGESLVRSVIFSSLDPDRFTSRVRFPVAVRLDRPYAFRVTRVGNDGSERVATDWTERESWTALLDVTRPSTSTDGPSQPPLEDTP